jgi:hypothetical protein
MLGLGIRAVLRVSDSRFEVHRLKVEDTPPIESTRFFPFVGLNSGEKFQPLRSNSYLTVSEALGLYQALEKIHAYPLAGWGAYD